MLVTLVERTLSAVIKQLENLDPETTAEEISERMPHFAARLFKHTAEFGVTNRGIVSHTGGLGIFKFDLKPIDNRFGQGVEERALRFEGLRLMQPNSVTVEYEDIPALWTDVVKASVEMAWDDIAPTLQKLSLSELAAALDGIAQNAVFGKPGPSHIANIVGAEEGYEYFLEKAGKKDPLADYNAREAAQQAELARIKAAEDARFEQQWGQNRE